MPKKKNDFTWFIIFQEIRLYDVVKHYGVTQDSLIDSLYQSTVTLPSLLPQATSRTCYFFSTEMNYTYGDDSSDSAAASMRSSSIKSEVDPFMQRVLDAFGSKSLGEESCYVCDTTDAALFQTCLRCCAKTTALMVTPLVCTACDDRTKEVYQSMIGSKPDKDIWLFHHCHRQLAPTAMPDTDPAVCELCKEPDSGVKSIESRCCSSSSAIECTTRLCTTCFEEKMRLFSTECSSMAIVDFNVWLFHNLNCGSGALRSTEDEL